MSGNIVLIGFMGVGKGQVARALALYSARYALDSDDLIESSTNMKIKKIFSIHGEAEFRELERKTAHWLRKNVRSSIISTGGGFVNVPNLKKIGTIIYLHADFRYIIKSLKSHPNADKKIKKRPLLKDLENAERLYNQRLPIYTKAADFVVDISKKDIQSIVKEVSMLCKLSSSKN